MPAYAVCSQSGHVLCLGWADTQRLGDARSDGGMSVLAKNGCPQLLAECRRRCPCAEWPFWLPRSSRDGPPSRVPMRAFTRFGYASAGLAEAVVRDTSTDQSEIEASQGRAVSQATQLFFSSYGQSGGPSRTVISRAGQCCGSPCALGLPQPPSTARWETQTTRRSAPGRGLMQPKPVYQVRPRALLARKRKIS
jgi:hypothetical protein